MNHAMKNDGATWEVLLPASPRHRALTRADLDAIGAELDALRSEVVASLGEREASYIRQVQAIVRYTEIAGRGLLFAGWLPPAWLAGTSLLAVSKIVDNMELGHNVMHGQYDWMNEPTLRGDTYEWDNACEGDAWRHSHNYLHHTFTNVEGRDRDIGYGFLRLFPTQPWQPLHLIQPAIAVGLAVLFQWGVALHDLELDRVVRGKVPAEKLAREAAPVLRKGLRQLAKDYVLFPVLAGPAFLPVLTGNLVANLARNLWTFGIIFCGHFTADVETFPETVLENESRGAWYVRQMRGSSNLTGGPFFHFLSGNLSHQIEHHLFPDVPAVRYADMAERVRDLCERYGQYYNTGSFWSQFTSVVARIVRYALPLPSFDAAIAA
jgi:NADPH-dependent stearoyl-CoA 9-desaturase